jgi:hypothetical protein
VGLSLLLVAGCFFDPAGSGTEPSDPCDGAVCTGDYCDSLENYCRWGNEAGAWSMECPECVKTFVDGAVDFPGTWCREKFLCWGNCVDQNESAGRAAVESCVDFYCDLC